jgi:hypothetical protein
MGRPVHMVAVVERCRVLLSASRLIMCHDTMGMWRDVKSGGDGKGPISLVSVEWRQ